MTSETELQNAKDAKEIAILDLFDSYPSAKASDSNIDAYLKAVESLSVEAVTRSVTQFTSGLVERDNRDFAPSAEAFAANTRKWQAAIDSRDGDGITLHTGLLNMDFGAGSIDMRGLTEAEQDAVIAAKGRAPDGRSLAYMPLAEIKAALGQADLAQVEGGKTFKAPALGRMT